jgi:hypothetical protein
MDDSHTDRVDLTVGIVLTIRASCTGISSSLLSFISFSSSEQAVLMLHSRAELTARRSAMRRAITLHTTIPSTPTASPSPASSPPSPSPPPVHGPPRRLVRSASLFVGGRGVGLGAKLKPNKKVRVRGGRRPIRAGTCVNCGCGEVSAAARFPSPGPGTALAWRCPWTVHVSERADSGFFAGSDQSVADQRSV